MSYKVHKTPREMPRYSRRATDQLQLPVTTSSVFARLWGDLRAVCEKLFGGIKR